MDLTDEYTRAIFFALHDGLPRQGPGRNVYTARAYSMLPPGPHPRILDIGCGPGTPTIELARMSRGMVVGVDTHRPFLDELTSRGTAAGLSKNIAAVHASMEALPFLDESFDLFWAEGSIYNMGFERGLRAWRRLLKPGGGAALHEAAWLRTNPPEEARKFWGQMYPGMTTVEECLGIIASCGYTTLSHFALPPDAWWDEYYGPLEEKMGVLRERYQAEPRALAILEEEAEEITIFKKYGEYFGAVFFILQKSGAA